VAVVDGAHDQHAPQLEGDHSPRPGAVTEFLDDPEMWVSNEISAVTDPSSARRNRFHCILV